MSVTRLSLPISEVIHVEIVKLEPHPSHFFMSYLLVLILLGFRNHILSQSGNEVNQWKTYFSSQTHYINTKRSQVHLGTYLHVTIIITFFSLPYDDNLNCLSLNLCIMLHLGSFPIEVLLTFDIYRITFHNMGREYLM